jgi:hypothetical protein
MMPKRDIDNIVINLNNITKRQMLEWRQGRQEIDRPDELDEYDFDNLYALVIEAWPHGEISFEVFLDLSYPESVRVDNAVSGAINGLTEKK